MTPRFKSIVSRIVWLHIIAVGVTSIAVIAAIYFVLDATTATFENQVLRDHAATIALYLSVSPDGDVDLNLPADIHTMYAHGFDGFAYAVVDRSGKVLFSSRAGNEAILASDPRSATPLYFQNSQRRPLYYGASIPESIGTHRIWIQVGQDLEDPDVIVDDIVADFLGRVAWFMLPIMLLLMAIDIAVVRRALRPVVRASEMARTINPARIDLRLPTGDLPSEVSPLVEAVNQALDRLEGGFRAQREFTADAAHELRTPLSVLRTRIDMLSDREVADSLRADVEIMTRTVEQLLAIAEIEHFPIDRTTTVDLQDICADVTALVAPLALAQSKDIALIGEQLPVLVKGDRQTLFQAIRNLAENAIEHTAPDTTVEIAVYSEGIVQVMDKGPGVAESDREMIFHRFWRGERGRQGGAGLGLSIVTRIAEAHGGSIAVENRLMGGAIFTLTLTSA